MKTSESVKEIFAALAKAQAKIKGAVKDSANPFFKSKYADLASVIEAIREPFAANGLCYVQGVSSEPETHFPIITTRIAHSSGEWLEECVTVPLSKLDAQSIGSATTYMRRYSLSAMAGLAQVDDDGNAATQAAPTSVASISNATLTADQQENIGQIADRIQGIYKSQGPVEAAKEFELLEFTDPSEKTFLWSLFGSKERAALRVAIGELKKAHA